MKRTLLLTFALACPTAAASAATWDTPTTVSQPRGSITLVDTAMHADGGLAAGWNWRDGVTTVTTGSSTALRSPYSSTTWGPERPALPGLVAFQPYASAQDISLGIEYLPQLGAGGVPVQRLTGLVSGGVRAPLAEGPIWSRPVLGAVAMGYRAIAAWTEVRQASEGLRRIVRVATRQDATWHDPRTISGRGQAGVVAAATGTNGDCVVVFPRNGRLLARVRRSGADWGPLQTLQTYTGTVEYTIRAAIDQWGSIAVAWRRHVQGGVTALESRVQPAEQTSFGPLQSLAADKALAGFALGAINPRGWAVSDFENTTRGRLVTIHLTGPDWVTFQPPIYGPAVKGSAREVTMAAKAPYLPLVAWVQPPTELTPNGVVQGAMLNASLRAFDPVEAVSGLSDSASAVRVESGAGVVSAVWVARLGGGTGPAYVRASTRRR